jgi:hypothetical protein
MKKRLVICAAFAAIMTALCAAEALASPITISKSGAYGYWAGEISQNMCISGSMGTYIQPVQPYVTRASQYATQTQTIRMYSRIEYWNGSAWKYYTQDSTWTSRAVQPGQYALFSTLDIDVQHGLHYRVVQFYEWWVNGVRVGTATNRFDQSEYLTLGGSVGSTTEGGYCYL